MKTRDQDRIAQILQDFRGHRASRPRTASAEASALMTFALTGFLVAVAMLLTMALPSMSPPSVERGPSKPLRWKSVDAQSRHVFRALRANQSASARR